MSANFAKALAGWFQAHGRDYPWRRTTDPYAILVSEMMLQQTRVSTVLEKGFYDRWMARFPDAATLAEAEDDEILHAWAGLGYYRRARLLRDAARMVAETGFPEDLNGLRALPGVGDYTAAALLAFAFDKAAPMVDGNVARVLARLHNYRGDVMSPEGRKQIVRWAAERLPGTGARVYQGALMELGQTICRVGVPTCAVCPVRAWCRAERPEELPVRPKASEPVRITERVMVARKNGLVLLEKIEGNRRAGLWKFPDAPEALWSAGPIWKGQYGITKYRVTLFAYCGEGGEGTWIDEGEIDRIAMAAPYRRLWTELCASETKRGLL